MKIKAICNCTDGDNILIVQDNDKERFFKTKYTVLNIRNDKVLLSGEEKYIDVCELMEVTD